MAQIRIDTTRLLAASLCASSEETRYYLNGVYVMPAPDPETGRGALLVATDGHRMALIHDPEGSADTGRILRLDWKNKVLKAQRGESARVLHIDGIERGKSAVAQIKLDYDSDSPQVDVLTVNEIDGVFPTWERALPGTPSPDIAVHGGNFFNPSYLADFDKAFRLLTGSKDGSFAVQQPEKGGPAWVLSDMAPYARFVIAPMRRKERVANRPYWIDAAISARG